jgi:hypothetical protein
MQPHTPGTGYFRLFEPKGQAGYTMNLVFTALAESRARWTIQICETGTHENPGG